ncbi:MAG: NADPH-dependent F420 reductase [Pseudonocardiaceae bacterium]|nr:NADPH-dependent F420 reductase [Pseudonocardiaceae bacterium]
MSQPDLSSLTVGVLGGTGPQGRGLAYRWSVAGLPVVLGSRDAGRAGKAADELAERSGSDRVRGADNAGCAAAAGAVLVAVPFDGHAALLEPLRNPLAGKIVIDCVNALGFDSRGPYALQVPEGSAAQQAESLLPESRVTAAFHHVSAVLLDDPAVTSVDADVLVLGDDREATDLVRALAELVPGVRGIYGGRLRNAAQVESLTANLIAVNRRYKGHAGIRITGL